MWVILKSALAIVLCGAGASGDIVVGVYWVLFVVGDDLALYYVALCRWESARGAPGAWWHYTSVLR